MTRTGRTYTPARTVAYEAAVRDAWTASGGPLLDGPVHVTATFTDGDATVTVESAQDSGSRLRGDLDNYVKAVLDGLQGVAFANDKAVQRVVAVKHGGNSTVATTRMSQ